MARGGERVRSVYLETEGLLLGGRKRKVILQCIYEALEEAWYTREDAQLAAHANNRLT